MIERTAFMALWILISFGYALAFGIVGAIRAFFEDFSEGWSISSNHANEQAKLIFPDL